MECQPQDKTIMLRLKININIISTRTTINILSNNIWKSKSSITLLNETATMTTPITQVIINFRVMIIKVKFSMLFTEKEHLVVFLNLNRFQTWWLGPKDSHHNNTWHRSKFISKIITIWENINNKRKSLKTNLMIQTLHQTTKKDWSINKESSRSNLISLTNLNNNYFRPSSLSNRKFLSKRVHQKRKNNNRQVLITQLSKLKMNNHTLLAAINLLRTLIKTFHNNHNIKKRLMNQ